MNKNTPHLMLPNFFFIDKTVTFLNVRPQGGLNKTWSYRFAVKELPQRQKT
jgi:hypothetical protein